MAIAVFLSPPSTGAVFRLSTLPPSTVRVYLPLLPSTATFAAFALSTLPNPAVRALPTVSAAFCCAGFFASTNRRTHPPGARPNAIFAPDRSTLPYLPELIRAAPTPWQPCSTPLISQAQTTLQLHPSIHVPLMLKS